MNVETIEDFMKIYKAGTPVYVKPWGESTLHDIRFIAQRYDKETGEPYVVLTIGDDIVREDE